MQVSEGQDSTVKSLEEAAINLAVKVAAHYHGERKDIESLPKTWVDLVIIMLLASRVSSDSIRLYSQNGNFTMEVDFNYYTFIHSKVGPFNFMLSESGAAHTIH